MKYLLVMLTIALCCVTSYPASSVELELKGMKLGSTIEEFQKTYPKVSSGWSTPGYGGWCKEIHEKGFTSCEYTSYSLSPMGNFTIAGIFTVPTYLFRDKLLTRISAEFFNPENNFPNLLAAFESKYSKPTSIIDTPIRTGNGVEYINKTVIWRLPDGDITLTKYAGTINKSLFVMRSNWMIDFDKELNELKSKESKKDI